MISVAVYSDNTVVRGDEIAAVINQNKDTFSVVVRDAIVGKSPYICLIVSTVSAVSSKITNF